jgi:hypothetical protein
MIKKLLLLSLLSILLFVSCDEKLLEVKQVDCYFQYEYVNYAWGYQHSGFTVTPTGEIYSFGNTTPWVFAENDKLTLATLKNNIEASTKADTLINITDIDHFQQLASYITSGKLSEPVSLGADMGERICKIIMPDTSDPQNGYREIILTEDGDFERHNLSSDAAIIVEWLTKLRFH